MPPRKAKKQEEPLVAEGSEPAQEPLVEPETETPEELLEEPAPAPAETLEKTHRAPAVILLPYRTGKWGGYENYECFDCPYSTTKKERILEHVMAGHVKVNLPEDDDSFRAHT